MPAPDRSAVGRAIKTEMQEQGLSIMQLVDRCGVTYRTLRSALDGKRWMRTGSRVAIGDALGWDRDWIDLIGDGYSLRDLKAERRKANLPKPRDPRTITVDQATVLELRLALDRIHMDRD